MSFPDWKNFELNILRANRKNSKLQSFPNRSPTCACVKLKCWVSSQSSACNKIIEDSRGELRAKNKWAVQNDFSAPQTISQAFPQFIFFIIKQIHAVNHSRPMNSWQFCGRTDGTLTNRLNLDITTSPALKCNKSQARKGDHDKWAALFLGHFKVILSSCHRNGR